MVNSISRRTVLAGAVAAGAAASLDRVQSASAASEPCCTTPVVPTLTKLGTPINNVAINKVSYGIEQQAAKTYVVTNGGEGVHFNVVDVRTGKTDLSLPVPDASGGWDTATGPDGSVYAATYPKARLLRYRPGATAVEDLGQPYDGAQYLLSLAIAADGTVFVGEYPTGKLFSYAGGEFRDYGRLSADSTHIRGLAVWRGTVLAALGTQHAHLYAVDVESGVKTEIPLPEQYQAEREIKRVTVVGDRAYVWLTDAKALLVYDLLSTTWSSAPGTSSGVDVSPEYRGEIYHVDGSRALRAYNPSKGTSRLVRAFDGMFSSRGFAWIDLADQRWPDLTLVMLDYIGRIWKYNPKTRRHSVELAEIPGEPVPIRSLAVGPDRRIYTSGYGSGGFAFYDPATGAMEQYPRGTVGQAEEMRTIGDQLYLGEYPGGNVLRFDPSQPFDFGTNPVAVASLASAQQERVFGMAEAAGLIVVGSVPIYGQLTGAVSTYDPATGAVNIDRGVVGTHSVITLVSDGTIVYGGTCKWGGLGITPPPSDGKVFAYDPVARTKLWEIIPVPGQPAITELARADDGRIWGYTSGTLFAIDPATRTVVKRVAVPPENWAGANHVYSEGQRLAIGPDGCIYVAAAGRLLRVDPLTGASALISAYAYAFAVFDEATLYTSMGTDLYRLTLQ